MKFTETTKNVFHSLPVVSSYKQISWESWMQQGQSENWVSAKLKPITSINEY